MAHLSYIHHLSADFFPLFSLSLYFCLSLSSSVSLALVCCRFNIRTLPVIRWQGCTPSQISKSAVLPEKCVGDYKPLTSAREAQCIISEYKLCRRTQQLFCFLFFFLQCHNKGRIKQREAFYSPKPEWLQRMTKEEVIRRKREYHEETTNESNVSQLTYLVLLFSLLLAKSFLWDRSGLDCCSIA